MLLEVLSTVTLQTRDIKGFKKSINMGKKETISRIQSNPIRRNKDENATRNRWGVKREEYTNLGGFIRMTSFSNSSSTCKEEDQQSIETEYGQESRVWVWYVCCLAVEFVGNWVCWLRYQCVWHLVWSLGIRMCARRALRVASCELGVCWVVVALELDQEFPNATPDIL